MWELGSRLPDVEMLDHLADCLNVDIQYFLDAILDKNKPEPVIDIEKFKL